jgi:hypothetical protein
LNSTRKKIKIEIEDNEGDKYNLSLEGKFSKEKLLKVIELMDSFQDETVKTSINHSIDLNQENTISLGVRLWNIINNRFTYQKFSSSDLSYAYNHTYKENIQLSIVSTYLSRFFMRNKLQRVKNGKEWIYSINHITTQDVHIHDITNHNQINVVQPLKTSQDTQDILCSYESIPTVYDLHQ